MFSGSVFRGRTPNLLDADQWYDFGGYYISDTRIVENLPSGLPTVAHMLVFGQYSGSAGRLRQLLISDTGMHTRYCGGAGFTSWVKL